MDAHAAPFWGTPTASIDWCERNYVVCYFIAEFWNALSSLAIALLGFLGCYLSIKEGLERRFTLLYILIIIVGFGSVAFHGTLLLSSQLLDELPMFWTSLCWIYVIFRMDSAPQKGMDVQLPLALVLFGGGWSVAAPWVHYHYPLIFQVLFISNMIFCIGMIHRYCRVVTHPAVAYMWYSYLLSLALGCTFWLIDKHACGAVTDFIGGHWLYAYVGSLHGYWHALMAINSYLGPAVGAAARAHALGQKFDIFYWAGLFPFVRLEQRNRSSRQSPTSIYRKNGKKLQQ